MSHLWLLCGDLWRLTLEVCKRCMNKIGMKVHKFKAVMMSLAGYVAIGSNKMRENVTRMKAS